MQTGTDPLALLWRERDEQLRLCDDLEDIADRLGGELDDRICKSVAEKLHAQYPMYLQDEEVFYHILCETQDKPRYLAACVEQAISDHRRLGDYALAVADQLQNLVAPPRARNAEGLGFELRCVFDGIRHHIAWEDVTLRGAYRRSLSAAEMDQFRAGIAAVRRNLRRPPRIAEPRD